MKIKYSLISILIYILFISPARADILIPALIVIYGISGTVLLIPVILIESAIAYFYIRKLSDFKARYGYVLLIFLAANIISSIIGFALSFFIPIGSKNLLSVSWMIIPAYLISSTIEFPVIYLLMKNKIQKALTNSAKISFFVNMFSYILIFIFILIYASY